METRIRVTSSRVKRTRRFGKHWQRKAILFFPLRLYTKLFFDKRWTGVINRCRFKLVFDVYVSL